MAAPAQGQYKIDIGEALSAGWSRFWRNIGPMALFAVMVWGINLLFQIPQREMDPGFGAFALSIVAFVLSTLVTIGWLKIALDITDGRSVTASGVTDRFQVLVPYLLASILFSVMVGVGFLFLIVPGIIVAVIFGLYGFHIVDTGERSPLKALARSAELTRGNRGRLFLLGLVLFGLNLLGLLALVVGVLLTSGISLLAITHVYRRLAPAVHAGTEPGPATA